MKDRSYQYPIKWLKEGDCNLAFFHSIFWSRKALKAISTLSIDGQMASNQHVILNHIVEFYENLLKENMSRQALDFNVVLLDYFFSLAGTSSEGTLLRLCIFSSLQSSWFRFEFIFYGFNS